MLPAHLDRLRLERLSLFLGDKLDRRANKKCKRARLDKTQDKLFDKLVKGFKARRTRALKDIDKRLAAAIQ